jgi:hypothetical protein
MGTKLVELFANRVVERRNMVNDYLRGDDGFSRFGLKTGGEFLG